MKNWYNKSPVTAGLLVGQGLFILFILFEYFLVITGISDCGVIADSCIRIAFGVIALFIISSIYREQFWRLFSAKIPNSTWLYCLPFFLYLAVEFLYFPISDHITTAYVSYYLLACLNQLATGFWEEAASKGLVMSGMLSKWERTKKGRIGMVFITGILFGSLHITNVLFNHDLIFSIVNAIYSSAFGIFMAAIYLHAKNITLCMVLHAIWDIIIRIPGNFCEGIQDGAILTFICESQDILLLGIFPIISVIICILSNNVERTES